MDEASKLLSRDDEEKLDKDKVKQRKLRAVEEEVLREYKEAGVRPKKVFQLLRTGTKTTY